MEKYSYPALQHPEGATTIRLILLPPTTSYDAPLRCKLSTTSIPHPFPGEQRTYEDDVELLDHDPHQNIMNEPCQYAALSYTWGPPVFDKLLLIHSPQSGVNEKVSYLKITSTLDDALRRIRNATEEVVIWADAVCINQQDILEKNRQLGTMGRIYLKASKVIAYLGEDLKCDWRSSVDDELCSKLLERLREIRTSAKYQADPDAPWEEEDEDLHNLDGLLREPDPGIQADMAVEAWRFINKYGNGAIDEFFRKDYFNRRWTIQERYYARNNLEFRCAITQTPWGAFEQRMVLKLLIAHIATDRDRLTPASFASLNSETDEHEIVDEGHMSVEKYDLDPYQPSTAKQAPGRLNNILTFMLRYKHAESYDPRDRIFALLDVIRNEYHPHLRMLKVGYDATVEKVYIAFARMLYYDLAAPLGWTDYPRPKFHDEFAGWAPRLKVDRVNSRILSVAGAMRSKDNSLESLGHPSWVPDWREEISYEINKTEAQYEGEEDFIYEVSTITRTSSNSYIFHQPGIHALCTEGTLLATVKKTIPLPEVNMIGAIHTLRALEAELKAELPTLFSTHADAICALVPLLLIGNHPLIDHFFYDKNDSSTLTVDYWNLLSRSMRGRVVFVTGNGHVGTAPEDVIPGDQVWMLGYPVQFFVMRPVTAIYPRVEDNRSWKQEWDTLTRHTVKLVGDGFLCGEMKIEGVGIDAPGQRAVRTVCIL